MENFPTSFAELLAVLQGPAAVFAVIWATSWGLEEMAGWQKLSKKLKSLIILGFAIVLGAGAVWFSGHPDWVAAAEPYIKMVLGVTGAWLGTQVVHRTNSKAQAKREVNNILELREILQRDRYGAPLDRE